jgi:hypothetical protein
MLRRTVPVLDVDGSQIAIYEIEINAHWQPEELDFASEAMDRMRVERGLSPTDLKDLTFLVLPATPNA